MAVVLAEQNLRADGDVVTESNIEKMNVTDTTQERLLGNILKELKKMNLHFAILNDDIIEDTEVR